MKKKKIIYKILIGLIVLLIITSITLNYILIKKFIEKDTKLLIKENPKVCYMPKDCFETEQEYLDQFPGKKEPKLFPECLVYCYK